MTDKEAIKYLQQLYSNGGHCWLDEQRIEAIGMAVKALQEEPVSENLKEAAKKEAEIVNALGGEFPPNPLDMELIKTIFIHGAKWQKEQDQKTIELAEDHAMLAGMEKMKEQMMTKAIDAEVLENYDGKVIKYDETILDEKLSDCKVFDKIKLIMLKDD